MIDSAQRSCYSRLDLKVGTRKGRRIAVAVAVAAAAVLGAQRMHSSEQED